jgi:hypothetical protein
MLMVGSSPPDVQSKLQQTVSQYTTLTTKYQIRFSKLKTEIAYFFLPNNIDRSSLTILIVGIDNRILGINGSKNRGHVGGRRHKSRRNVKLFKSIKFVLFVQEEKEGENIKRGIYIVNTN